LLYVKLSGGRVSELLALRWQDVNLETGTIEIRRSMSTAKVKGEVTQEKVRWFDPKTKQGKEGNSNPAATNRNAQGMEREMPAQPPRTGIL
jgi:integrase